MRFDEVRRRLSTLPKVMPRPPREIEPRVLAQPDRLPEWARRPSRVKPRDAAALVLLYPDAAGDAVVILTERPHGDLRHAGQVSLPGGASEVGDEFPVGTALREAREEIGLDPLASEVEVIGVLETVDVRVSGFMLIPVLAVAPREPLLRPDPREVAAILHVPVATFLSHAPIEVVEEERDGSRLRYGAYRSAEHRIWGATARVLAQLGAILSDHQGSPSDSS